MASGSGRTSIATTPRCVASDASAAWAGVFLAVQQLLLVVVLLLANRVAGGVVAYQVAFKFFLLPYALFGLPVMTAYFPTMSRQVSERDWRGYAQAIERGFRAMAYFLLPAAAALTALAPVLARSVLFGETGEAGAAQVAGVLVGLAPGAFGYASVLFLSRTLYARADTRTPALVNIGIAVGGSLLMIIGFAAVDGTLRVPALAVAHSVAFTVGAVVLHRRRRRPDPRRRAAPDGSCHRPVARRRGGGWRGDVGCRRADRPAGEGRLDRRDGRGRGGRTRAVRRAGGDARRSPAVVGGGTAAGPRWVTSASRRQRLVRRRWPRSSWRWCWCRCWWRRWEPWRRWTAGRRAQPRPGPPCRARRPTAC